MHEDSIVFNIGRSAIVKDVARYPLEHPASSERIRVLFVESFGIGGANDLQLIADQDRNLALDRVDDWGGTRVDR